LYDVHPNAAARQIGNRISRGKAGLEDQVEDLGVGQVTIFRKQATLTSFGENLVAAQSAAVILDLDDNAAGIMKCIQGDGATRGLTALTTHFRRLYAVVNGISDQVREWIAYLLDDSLVELRILTAQHERDVFAKLAGDVVHHPFEALKSATDLDHPQL